MHGSRGAKHRKQTLKQSTQTSGVLSPSSGSHTGAGSIDGAREVPRGADGAHVQDRGGAGCTAIHGGGASIAAVDRVGDSSMDRAGDSSKDAPRHS